MGNCLTCFRTPPPLIECTVLDSYGHRLAAKEDMSEGRLYRAPSHVSPCTAVIGVDNGNGKTCVSEQQLAPVEHHSRFYQRRVCVSAMAPADQTSVTWDGGGGKVGALFDMYRDAAVGGDDLMLAEGIERLCQDLQMSPDEFRVLVLAWKLKAEQMCRFTRHEFVHGCREMRVDSIRSMQCCLGEIVMQLECDPELFKDLYRFTFRFGLDVSAGQRILPTDMAICLWRLVFSIREPPILGRWLCFLDVHQQVRGIPRDTWNMFLNFSESVGDDLSSYDDNEAWPSLFDDFVEYENDQMNQNISKAKESDSLLIKNEN